MTWCEANGVHFRFGLQQNSRLVAEITSEARVGRGGEPADRKGLCVHRFTV
jgi:hypothetical protein